jgi:hypothetical protein
MSKCIRTSLLSFAALAFAPYGAAAQGEPSYINCAYGFAVVFPMPPSVRDTTYKTMTGATIPAREFYLDNGADKLMVTVATFPDGPAVDEKAIDHAADAIKTRGEVRFQGAGDYDPGMPGRQLNVFENAGRQLRASVYMVDHKLYITESLAAPGDFAALQFEQSIALIDSKGTDRDTNAGDPPRVYTCQ